MTIYKKQNIKTLTINKSYSVKGESKINLSEFGIDLDLYDLESIIKLSDDNFNLITLNDYYQNFFESMNIKNTDDCQALIGYKKSIEYMTYIKDSIKSIKDMITTYHTEIFPIRKKCYEDLHQVIYDYQKLELPTYNHKSGTGRTSIIKGYNFLIKGFIYE